MAKKIIRIRYFLIAAFLAAVSIYQPVFAQFYSQGFGGGIGIGALLGHTELDTKLQDKRAEPQLRGYIRHRIFNHLQGELGAGIGELEGKKYSYRVQLIPVDYRLVWSPLASDSWSPYLYAGGGILGVDVKNVPHIPKPDSASYPLGKLWKGWTAFAPVGIGMQFKLNDYASLDISGGIDFTLIDSLNGVKNKTGRKDQLWSFMVGIATAGISRDADPDNDGLTNREEEQLGTDAKNSDTDGDGLRDGEEINKYKTSPLKADTDGDSLRDGDEIFIYKTNPNSSDSDDDGLTDGEEVLTYHTDPLKTDTDGDGLSDGDEVRKYRTDPLKVDTDGDGLSDYDEIMKYHTDPIKSDTDGDGLNDGDEILKYHTDPLKTDTDGDGLSDFDEAIKYHSDPLKKDTDNGSVDDGTEVARGTNPLDPSDDVPKKPTFSVEVGQKIVLEGVVFKSGKADISPQSEAILEKAFNTMKAFPEIQVEIQGHTDDKGKRDKNLKLSQDRADAVKAFMVRKGIEPDRIITKGYGPDRPLVLNTTSEGRQTNRRIEFVRTK